MLHSAFERAVKERLIPHNPTDDCIAPKVQKVEMKTLRPEHLKSYLEAANARGVLPMFYLELVSGLRKGELITLLWDDLDIQNRTISVSKQYIKNPSGKLTLSRYRGTSDSSIQQTCKLSLSYSSLFEGISSSYKTSTLLTPARLIKCLFGHAQTFRVGISLLGNAWHSHAKISASYHWAKTFTPPEGHYTVFFPIHF